jgi:transcriptional antiterminator RfaH
VDQGILSSIIPSTVQPSWYVVQTKTWAEGRVEARLVSRSIETFLPRIENPRRRRPPPIEPLFPGYLFVHLTLSQNLLDIVRWTPGVRRLLGSGEFPLPLDEQVITTIRSRLGEEGFIRVGLLFVPGDRVRIAEGPMAGLCGILERLVSRANRVRVLLDLMHVPVELDWRLLEAE